ncbi:MAG: septum site-determining protein MinC [Pseudomonadota bacterium]|jgi:septum site-determining protein MinC
MNLALAGQTPSTFEIKSAHLPLVSLRLMSTDLAALSHELAQRFGDIPDFFDNDALVIDLTPLTAQGNPCQLDFAALGALLRRYRLVPVAVRGGDAAQMQAALQAGLAPVPDAEPARPVQESAVPLAAPVAQPAMVIDRPLRSGQQVYARGRDLVLLAMVNAGAEVIADGHIHVYAPLRGKAMAGARGNAQARIFALSMEPELISIAGVYRTTDTALPPDVWGKPTQVRLEDDNPQGKLLLEPLRP